MPDPIDPTLAARRRDPFDAPANAPAERVHVAHRLVESYDHLAGAPDESPVVDYSIAIQNPALRGSTSASFFAEDARARASLYTDLARMGDTRGCRAGDTLDSLAHRASALATKRAIEHETRAAHDTTIDYDGHVGTTESLARRDQLARIDAANPGSGLGIVYAAIASMRGAAVDEIRSMGEMGNATEGVVGSVGLVLLNEKSFAPESEAPSDAKESAISPQAEVAVKAINGRRPMNAKLAWESYPVEKLPADVRASFPIPVRFKATGFPDFGSYVKAQVRPPFLDGTSRDNQRANIAAGFGTSIIPPDGYTWHHHEDGRTMQLVPTSLHRAIKHTGGRATLVEGRKEKL